MFGPRMLFGAAVGGALVYFLDPVQGTQRRERLRQWWEQNREPMMNSAASAASTAQARVEETSARVGDAVNEFQSKVRRESDREDTPNRQNAPRPTPVK
jgi:gas vesicle protein